MNLITGIGGGRLARDGFFCAVRRHLTTLWKETSGPCLAVFLFAVVVQLNPAWRAGLIYDREAIAHGELWRLWSGHLVHFGWPHFVGDAGLLAILSWPLGRRHRLFASLALVLMPLFISLVLYFFDPAMSRYAGLSALDLGLLLFLAAQGWQRDWTDWFWPAVLGIYVAELVIEIARGGRGGGMIQFDDTTVHVATSAHIASAVYALLAWAMSAGFGRNPKRRVALPETSEASRKAGK
jgi:rhomboid family GlyGly-CTERM serine protease